MSVSRSERPQTSSSYTKHKGSCRSASKGAPFSYQAIKHVPGKDLVIPDMLSHAPAATTHEASLKISKEADGYLSFVISDLPASDQRFEEFRIRQDDDDVCAVVKQYTRDSWPPLHQVKGHTFYGQSCSP